MGSRINFLVDVLDISHMQVSHVKRSINTLNRLLNLNTFTLSIVYLRRSNDAINLID